MKNQILCKTYSGSMNEVIVTKFIYKDHVYIWDDIECVYFDHTEGDESYLCDCPFSPQFEED